MSFLFLQTGYDTGVRVSGNGTTAQRTGEGPAVVYLTQPLQAGNELVLHVTRSNVPSHGQAAVGVRVGVTTCPPSKIQQFSSHARGECRTDGPCGGQSALLLIQEWSSEFRIHVKRTEHKGQIYVKSGKWHASMAGMKFSSTWKLFPFLVMDGQVTSVRIGSESKREIGSLHMIPVSDPPVSRLPVTSPARTRVLFLIPPRPARHGVGEYSRYLRYSMHGVAKRVIFLNSDIKFGEPLTLSVLRAKQTEKGFSFVFGVTTCNRTTFGATYLHNFNYSNPSICGSHSKHCELPVLSVGQTVTIQRSEQEFILFKIGDAVYSLEDETGIFKDKKVFPYVMLSGSVTGLEILNHETDCEEDDRESLCSESSVAGGDGDGGYQFLVTRHRGCQEHANKSVGSQMQGARTKMTFIDRPLVPGKRLVIRVTRKHHDENICFTFGVTTCDRTSRNNPFNHRFDFSRPSTCRGHERHCEIPDMAVGGCVSFERTNDKQFILIRIGSQSFSLPDANGIFRNKNAFPYVMVNGSAYALEIISHQNDVPSICRDNEILPIHKFSYASSVQMSNASSLNSLHDETQTHKQWTDDYPAPSKLVAVVRCDKPVTEHHKRVMKWYGNPTISFKDLTMTRSGEPDELCFIFGEAFSPGDEFSFRVQTVDTSFRGSISFGVTKIPLHEMEMENVPKASNDQWLINDDVIPIITCDQVISIRRNESEITRKEGVADPVRLFRVPSQFKVHPFFRFNGSVKEIQILP